MKKRRTKKIHFVFIATVIILLLAFSYKYVLKGPAKESVQAGTDFFDCNDPEGEFDKNACDLIASDPRLNTCQSAKNAEYAFFCIGLISKNKGACENIKNKPYMYYLCRAYTDDNPEMCSMIGVASQEDNCYADIGMNTRNSEVCNKIVSESKKTTCFGVIDLDLKKCFADDETKNTCIVNVLEFSGGKSSCDELAGQDRQDCLGISGG